MQSKFSEAILEMQQKSGLKYLILEKKISAMKEELDVKEAQLHAVVEHGTTKKGDAFGIVVVVIVVVTIVVVVVVVVVEQPTFYTAKKTEHIVF